MASTPQTKVTNWAPFGHYGITDYRIWQRHDGLVMWQRHEWRYEDGSVDLEDWIRSVSSWCRDAQPVEA